MLIFRKLSSIYDKIRQRFIIKRWIIDSKLNRYSYHDLDTLMLHANMEILVDFVEKEDAFNVTMWDDELSQVVYDDLLLIYHWWKAYPNRIKKIDKLLNIGYYHDHKYEDELEILHEEEDKYLSLLIKHRIFLWT